MDKEKLNKYRKEYREECFGSLFKELRTEADLTQQQLAEQLGWPSSQYVANVENGNASFPAEKIRNLCKATNIDPKDIIESLLSIERKVLYSRVFNKKF